ncbi:phosphatidylethanolamine-binding protein-like protein [Tupanvirus soda lake]|uniref:Phosphatidylethanolamine-binding protein-like protein n=2 Tax=Tupanvirus TaxID=2094720 RepID=A0A6N1NI45_9VIRU|nr:phosphatidylethanolamine-binding protein-like protein [Tupanvirus soda lake]QKU34655.1 phosphatidylethanolamine-binding protein-like protein [Tupanvirus soda lake]
MNSFNVVIGNTTIKDGIFIPLDQIVRKPKIRFDRYPDELYTILMVDPDAPSRENPIYKYWLHLLIINNHQKIVSYEPPSPPKNSGKHRYIFYLLKQSDVLNKHQLQIPNINSNNFDRKNFSLDDFINDNDLKIISSVYFETEYTNN